MTVSILPEALLNEALQLRGADDDALWQQGDLIAAAVDELANGRITKTEVRDSLADVLGIAPSTARNRESCAREWAGKERKQWARDNLSWSHLDAARHAPEPEELLRRAVESADEYNGLPAPVRVVKVWAKEARGHVVPPPSWGRHVAAALAALERARALRSTPKLVAAIVAVRALENGN